MTKLLSKVLRQIKELPEDRQDDVAHVIQTMLDNGEVYQLSDEERRLIDEGLASPPVSETEMEKFWDRHQT
jgi:hypothetical protein